MAQGNVRPQTRDKILAVLGAERMTKQRLVYLVECSPSTIDALIKTGDIVIVARTKAVRDFKVIKGKPIICAKEHAERHRAEITEQLKARAA